MNAHLNPEFHAHVPGYKPEPHRHCQDCQSKLMCVLEPLRGCPWLHRVERTDYLEGMYYLATGDEIGTEV